MKIVPSVWTLAFAVSAAAAGDIVEVKREVYVPNTEPGRAPWVWVYPGKDGYREEIHTTWSHEDQTRGFGDTPMSPRRRVSHDDGKTWSPLEPLPELMDFRENVSILTWKFCGAYDPRSDRLISLSIHHVRDRREGPPRRLHNHALVQLSADGGASFGPARLLRYEEGGNFDPGDPLEPAYLNNNTAYPGQSILLHSNGSVIIPATNTRIPPEVGDEPLGRTIWPTAGTSGALCFVGRWNERKGDYDWRGGQPVWLPRETAYNGLLEADVAELGDGRVLMGFRVTKYRDNPAYKWISVSGDGGVTFSRPRPFTYSDGEHFYSPSTFHRFFRSGKTGKLYWIGNIVPEKPTNPGHPRYPLVIAEVDEASLGIRRETVTVIDTRQEGEGERMQLSNFWIIEQSESGALEIYLTRLFENPDELFTASAYRYTLTFHE